MTKEFAVKLGNANVGQGVLFEFPVLWHTSLMRRLLWLKVEVVF